MLMRFSLETRSECHTVGTYFIFRVHSPKSATFNERERERDKDEMEWVDLDPLTRFSPQENRTVSTINRCPCPGIHDTLDMTKLHGPNQLNIRTCCRFSGHCCRGQQLSYQTPGETAQGRCKNKTHCNSLGFTWPEPFIVWISIYLTIYS